MEIQVKCEEQSDSSSSSRESTPAEDNSNSTPVKLRSNRAFACTRCVGKKAKCDGVRPTCHRCQFVGETCVYLPTSRDIMRKNVEDLIEGMDELAAEMSALRRAAGMKNSFQSLSEQEAESSYGASPPSTDNVGNSSSSILSSSNTSGSSSSTSSDHEDNGDHPILRHHRELVNRDDLNYFTLRLQDINSNSDRKRQRTLSLQPDLSSSSSSSSSTLSLTSDPINEALFGHNGWQLNLTRNGLQIVTNIKSISELYQIVNNQSISNNDSLPTQDTRSTRLEKSDLWRQYGREHIYDFQSVLLQKRRQEHIVPKNVMKQFVIANEEAIIQHVVQQFFKCQQRPQFHRKTFLDIFKAKSASASSEHRALTLSIVCRWAVHTFTYHGKPPDMQPTSGGDKPSFSDKDLALYVRHYFSKLAIRLLSQYIDKPHPYIVFAMFNMLEFFETTTQMDKALAYHGTATRMAMALDIHRLGKDGKPTYTPVSRGQARRDHIIWTALVDKDNYYVENGYPRRISLEFSRNDRDHEDLDIIDIKENEQSNVMWMQSDQKDEVSTERLEINAIYSNSAEYLIDVRRRVMFTFYSDTPSTEADLEAFHRELTKFHNSLPPQLLLNGSYRHHNAERLYQALVLHNSYYEVLMDIYKLFFPKIDELFPTEVSLESLHTATCAALMATQVKISQIRLQPCNFHVEHWGLLCETLIAILKRRSTLYRLRSVDSNIDKVEAYLSKCLAVLTNSIDYRVGDARTLAFVEYIEEHLKTFGIAKDAWRILPSEYEFTSASLFA